MQLQEVAERHCQTGETTNQSLVLKTIYGKGTMAVNNKLLSSLTHSNIR
jgi:hypothetical protein